MDQNKNFAKRVPVAAVLSIKAEDDTDVTSGGEPAGLLEGNIAITRVVLVVTEAFGAGAKVTLNSTDAGGNVTTWFNDVATDAVTVAVSSETSADPVDGTPAPFFMGGKTLWDINLTTAGNLVDGELMMVIEYVQLDTEPGLHSSTPEGA